MGARKDRFKPEEIIVACEGTGGIKALIAKKVGCSRPTIVKYAKRYATVRKAIEDAKQARVDMAEGQHTRLIMAGYWPAIRYLLETHGRDRGYVNRQQHEISGPDGKDITIRVVGGVDVEEV
jgi:hypothetical protein